MYAQAIVTMSLCEAYGLSRDESLGTPAQRAINFIVAGQDPQGGSWTYKPFVRSGDTSITGWQVSALHTAQVVGLMVPSNTLERAKLYLSHAARDRVKSVYAYGPGKPPTPEMTAVGLLARQHLGWGRQQTGSGKGLGLVSDHLLTFRERDIYYWYHASQLLHNMGGDGWDRCNRRIRDGLVGMQQQGSACDRGSWDPKHPQPDRWSNGAGRLYLTALSVLTLEVYCRYPPLYKPRVNVSDPSRGDEKFDGVPGAMSTTRGRNPG